MNYTSHSASDRRRILEAIGFESVDDLIRRLIPEEFLSGELNLPLGASEAEVVREFKALAGANIPASEGICFMGGGVYDHYIPAAIGAIISRSEFATAYTPYQAEVAQGTLQTIYEFQTMVCRLSGMDAANASLYDGATALAEAMLLAVRNTGRNAMVLPATLNPMYREVITTYAAPSGIELRWVGSIDGLMALGEVEALAEGAAAVVVQQPNFFGLIEPAAAAAEAAHRAGALVIGSCYPTSLALLKPPGEWGADIFTAEGQSLGVPMSLGGPYVGLFAVKTPLVRFMPGRLVARAVDRDGKPGFVLTLQTREQHIRREKATSNICTNQALIALNALVYLSLVGPDGLKRAAMNSYRGAHYLARRLAEIPGCRLRFTGQFFSEFVLELPVEASRVAERLERENIFVGPTLGGFFDDMANCILIAVTEKRTRAEMDRLVELVRLIVNP